jgi:hypothetical protein
MKSKAANQGYRIFTINLFTDDPNANPLTDPNLDVDGFIEGLLNENKIEHGVLALYRTPKNEWVIFGVQCGDTDTALDYRRKHPTGVYYGERNWVISDGKLVVDDFDIHTEIEV